MSMNSTIPQLHRLPSYIWNPSWICMCWRSCPHLWEIQSTLPQLSRTPLLSASGWVHSRCAKWTPQFPTSEASDINSEHETSPHLHTHLQCSELDPRQSGHLSLLQSCSFACKCTPHRSTKIAVEEEMRCWFVLPSTKWAMSWNVWTPFHKAIKAI